MTTATVTKTIKVKIKRQDCKDSKPYFENFDIEHKPGLNIISLLMEIEGNPVNSKGEKTCPVSYESACLEEVCGSCTMVVNGKVRQACTTLIDQLNHPITIEPMSKFPTHRDLVVDRSKMFKNLKTVKAWTKLDGTYAAGPGPRVSQKVQEENYTLSRCMTCGCCLEACPQWTNDNTFIGAQAISQVVLFNSHPLGESLKDERTQALIDNGLQDCGNAQECVKACPKDIPLTDSIGRANREATVFSLMDWLRKS